MAKKQIRKKTGKCIECGAPVYPQTKFCSRECRTPGAFIKVTCPCGNDIPWVSESEERKFCSRQCTGRFSRKMLTVEGVTKTVYDWTIELGRDPKFNKIIYERLFRGWSPEEAVKTPPIRTNPKRKKR